MEQIEATGEAGKKAVEKVQLALAAATVMPAHRCELDNEIPQNFGEVPFRDLLYITEKERNKNYAHNMAQELTRKMTDESGMIIDQEEMKQFVINRYSVKHGEAVGRLRFIIRLTRFIRNQKLLFHRLLLDGAIWGAE